MNINTLGYIGVIAVMSAFIASCASQQPSSREKVELTLTVVHPKIRYNEHTGELLPTKTDNDGNQYVAHWEQHRDAELNQSFITTQELCQRDFAKASYLAGAQYISEVKIEDLKPKHFLDFVACMKESNFSPKSTDAYFPDYYIVNVHKTHTSFGNYMPVGGRFTIKKQKASYQAVLGSVNACAEVAKKEGAPSTLYDGSTIITSVVDYLAEIKVCLASQGYEIDHHKKGAEKRLANKNGSPSENGENNSKPEYDIDTGREISEPVVTPVPIH